MRIPVHVFTEWNYIDQHCLNRSQSERWRCVCVHIHVRGMLILRKLIDLTTQLNQSL